jgi:ketosteroid isomerase-like protein
MSQENVELVASVYEAFARRDDAAPFDVYATDIEWDQSRGFIDGSASVYDSHACKPPSSQGEPCFP